MSSSPIFDVDLSLKKIIENKVRKLSKDYTGKYFHDLGLGEDFLKKTQEGRLGGSVG